VVALAASFTLRFAIPCQAAAIYTVPGSSYSQDFNGLPTTKPNGTSVGNTPDGWIDDTTSSGTNQFSVLGWYLWHPLSVLSGSPPAGEGGANGHQRFRFGQGANTGSFWGFSSTNSSDTEKAMGDVGSTTTAANGDSLYIALRLSNNTGVRLNSFTLTYDGEEYRDGQSASPESLLFAYNVGATTTPNGGGVPNWADPTTTYTSVSGLNFTAPTFSGTGSSGTFVDGNLAANRTAGITATITGITWDPGTDLWLRWADPQLASNADDGLAIDNVSFSATTTVPEPSSLVLLGLTTLYLTARRRCGLKLRYFGCRCA
jgi:hypothetical protein